MFICVMSLIFNENVFLRNFRLQLKDGIFKLLIKYLTAVIVASTILKLFDDKVFKNMPQNQYRRY